MAEAAPAPEPPGRPGPVLISKAEIETRVKSLAEEISNDYAGQRIKVGIVLDGAIVFAADLVRQLSLDMEIFFVQASSYGHRTVSPGTVRIQRDPQVELAGAHVLVVDDILDSGHTAQALLDDFRSQGPATVRMAVLLNKQSRRRVDIRADYVGFEVPNKFVVGYGMDHSGSFRHLPSVHALD